MLEAQSAASRDHYSASVTIEGARVVIDAPALNVLDALIRRLTLSNAPQPVSAEQTAARAELDAQQAAPAPSAEKKASKAKTEPAAEAPGKSQSTAAASQETPAATPRTAEAAEDGAQPKGVSYDDVKRLVNALYAIKPQHAVDALADFKVKNGKELAPQDWPAFVEKAEARLAALKAS